MNPIIKFATLFGLLAVELAIPWLKSREPVRRGIGPGSRRRDEAVLHAAKYERVSTTKSPARGRKQWPRDFNQGLRRSAQELQVETSSQRLLHHSFALGRLRG
jgi:hypothetical protein